MDLIFKCGNCDQELSVNPSGAGTQIECPTCGQTITIPEPEPEPQTIRSINPISTSAAAKEEKHFAVPVRSTPTEVLVKTIIRPEVAKGGEKKLRVRTIKRTECLEVGHDKFDETVSDFLAKLGQENLISVTPITYSHFDLNSRQNMTDYGVFIVYKG